MKKRMLSNYSAIIFCGAFYFSLPNPTFCQAPNWMWADAPQGITSNDIFSITTDGNGNSYVAGSYFGSITFGNTTLSNAGIMDIFIVKYDASGNVLWAKSAGGNDNDCPKSIALDPTGGVFITGYFRSHSVLFDNIALINSGSADVFLVKYDASGNALWAIGAGGTGQDNGYGVAADLSGNAYITGDFEFDDLHFGNTTLNYSGNNLDMFIAKYDASGNLIWARSEAGSEFESGQSIATDAQGNFYLTGTFSDTIRFGTTMLLGTGARDIFVTKYDTSGAASWARSAQGDNFDIGSSIAAFPDGRTYLTGFYFSSVIVFGNDTLQNAGGSDIFIVEYDPSGNLLKAINAGGPGSETSQSIVILSEESSCITGDFSSPLINFGNTTLINSGIGNFFVAKESAGTFDWALSPNGYSNIGRNISTDGSGSLYMTGGFADSSLNLGNFTLLNTGTRNCFIGRLDVQAATADQNQISNSVDIYPNPCSGNFNVQSDDLIDEIQIRNLVGQLIYNLKPHSSKLNVSLENDGVYNLTITGGNQTLTRKLVVQH
jgi:hypothetical protein